MAKDEIRRLAAHGAVAAALAQFQRVSDRTLAEDPELGLLRAELLEQAGEFRRAREASLRLVSSFGDRNELHVRASVVLALVAFADGATPEAERILEEARHRGEASGDLKLRILPSLAALGTVADHWPRARLTAFISRVRRDVLNSGEPRFLALLHHYLAKFDAFEGNLSGALRHLAAAHSLNGPDEDLALVARILQTELNVRLLNSETEVALQIGSRSRRLAQQCGLKNLAQVVEATLGVAYLLVGRVDEAETLLREVQRSPVQELTRIVNSVNLADLALARGNTSVAELMIEQAIQLLDAFSGSGVSNYHIGTRETMLRILTHTGRWDAASKVAEDGLGLAEKRGERFWISHFQAMSAEVELRLGRSDEARKRLAVLLKSEAVLPTPVLAQINRVVANVLAVTGDVAGAMRYFAMSLGQGRSGNSAWLRHEAAEDWSAELSRTLGSAPSGSGGVRCALYSCGPIPEALQIRPDKTTDLAPFSPGASAFATERTVAALLDGEYNVPLFAEQVGSLLVDSQAAEGVVVASRADGRPPIAHLFAGWDYQTAVARVTTPHDAIIVEVGKHAGRQYRVVVQPQPALDAHLAVTAITRIATAALALEAYRRDEKERGSLWPFDATGSDDGEVFASDEMVEMVATARRLAPTDIPVLLSGETGTGKEVIARLVHRASRRASKPFLAFNCTAVPRDMLDSQLFGYRRGAFTGATEAFPGVIRAAAGGTLLLDEIGELGPDLQPKLLRFLERQEILPLGETTPARVDVRIVAATNADLDALVSEGRFRADLLYRLNGVHLHLPPLRKRREEIPLFVHRFLQRYGDELKKGRPRVSEETMEYLLLYAWPGNVRQLANEIRRAVALVDADGTITPDCLSAGLRASRRTIPANAPPPGDDAITVRVSQPLATAIEQVERLMISRALEGSNGNLEEAARRLGISRKGLFLKRQRLGLPRTS